MKKRLPLSLLTVALLSSLNASENQYTLQSINVTAAQGTTLEKKDLTESMTIITKEAIEESRLTTLSDALSQLGNVTLSSSGGLGQQTSLFVRGMDSRRVLILVDGVRYNDPTTPGAISKLEDLMLYNVERIEIIKGAQSGIWGSDASGGVINIITTGAKKGLHGAINLEYGSFDTKKTSLQASYGTEKYYISLSGLYLASDGFSAYEPAKSSANYGKRYDELGLEKDPYRNGSLDIKLGYNITKENRVQISAQLIDATVDFDAYGADGLVQNTKLENSLYKVDYQHRGSLHEITANYSRSNFSRESQFSTSFSGEYKGSVDEVKLYDKINYATDSFVRLGADYQLFTYKEQDGTNDKSYNSVAAYVSNYNKLKLFGSQDTIITESLRYDSYSNSEDALTGKLGLKQFVANEYYVSANIGTGFNAPTIGQIYGEYGALANPNLEPETSLTFDITLGSDMLWITGFCSEIDNLIEWYDPDGYIPDANWNDISMPAIYKNLKGKSKLQGIELGYEDFLFNTLGVGANYTYLETKDAAGKELARRPKSQFDVKATYYVTDSFDIGANAQYIGTRYDAADRKGAQTGEYTVLNLVSNVKVNKYITVYGRINNITDEYYQVVDGYASAGRSLFLGLTAKY